MFAKLFDHISVRSLVNAVGVSLALMLCLFWLPAPALSFQWFAESKSLPEWLIWPLGFVFCLITGIAYNELNNRERLFKNHNHFLPVFIALSLVLLLVNGFIKATLLLPLLLLYAVKLHQLLQLKDAKYLYFDLGMLTAVLTFLYGDLVFLLPLSWLLGIILSQINPRIFVASLLGYIAMVYFPIGVGGMFNIDLWSVFYENLAGISFSFKYSRAMSLWAMLPLLILLALSLFQYPQLSSRANNKQRLALNFWYALLFFGLLGWISSQQKMVWAAFLTFPFSWLIAVFVANTSNRWLRDSVYLLLIAGIAIAFLGRYGLIAI